MSMWLLVTGLSRMCCALVCLLLIRWILFLVLPVCMSVAMGTVSFRVVLVGAVLTCVSSLSCSSVLGLLIVNLILKALSCGLVVFVTCVMWVVRCMLGSVLVRVLVGLLIVSWSVL